LRASGKSIPDGRLSPPFNTKRPLIELELGDWLR
jgi:hypothetical protein